MNDIKEPASTKNYWPWFLMFIPFTAVIFGIFMITTTLYYPDDLVNDNYYKDGMAINKFLTMDSLANEMSVSASLHSVDRDQLEFNINNVRDSAIEMNLYHVTDKSLDKSFVLVPEGGSLYSVLDSGLDALSLKGVWYIELIGMDDHWRLRQRIETPVNKLEISSNE